MTDTERLQEIRARADAPEKEAAWDYYRRVGDVTVPTAFKAGFQLAQRENGKLWAQLAGLSYCNVCDESISSCIAEELCSEWRDGFLLFWHSECFERQQHG